MVDTFPKYQISGMSRSVFVCFVAPRNDTGLSPMACDYTLAWRQYHPKPMADKISKVKPSLKTLSLNQVPGKTQELGLVCALAT